MSRQRNSPPAGAKAPGLSMGASLRPSRAARNDPNSEGELGPPFQRMPTRRWASGRFQLTRSGNRGSLPLAPDCPGG
jgi:hypothetical protein